MFKLIFILILLFFFFLLVIWLINALHIELFHKILALKCCEMYEFYCFIFKKWDEFKLPLI